MSATQTLAKTILPRAWYDRMRESSERWMVQCSKCNSERSVWDMGGIRWGAASVGKRIATRCPECEEIVAGRLYYNDSVDLQHMKSKL